MADFGTHLILIAVVLTLTLSNCTNLRVVLLEGMIYRQLKKIEAAIFKLSFTGVLLSSDAD